jgi:hypothetical protein
MQIDCKDFGLVLHVLDGYQKQKRTIIAENMITILKKDAINSFQHILPVNDSLFFPAGV